MATLQRYAVGSLGA